MAPVSGDFSKGRVSLIILRLGMPMMLAEFVHVLYNIVDRMYIGHMAEGGTLALTGLGICFPLITLIGAFANLYSTGGATLATIARGAKEDEKAERIMGTSFSMLLLTGAVLTVLLYLTAPVTLRWLGGDDETMPAAMGYFRIYVLGTIPVLISLGMNPFISAQGFPKIGMMTVIIGAALNIVLDPLLIYTLNMGIRGAALATVIAQTASALWVLLFLRSRKAALRLTGPHLDRSELKRIVRLGITGFTFKVTNSITQAIVNIMLKAWGGVLSTVYVGAMSLINSLREIMSLPNSGIVMGGQSVMSYNYGAKQYSRVSSGIRFTFLSGLAINVVMWSLVMFIPEPLIRWFSIIGCSLLMMYYTTVAGWMMNYGLKHIAGTFVGKSPEEVTGGFGEMLGNPLELTFWTVLVCLIGFTVCYFGIQRGIERVTKYLMVALLVLMLILAIHSVFLDGADAGVRYYLVPNLENIADHGLGEVVFNAMSHAFFTLSIGVGSMLIFGSYIGRSRSLMGESVVITGLDTFVALTAGFIIIPSCFAYGVEVGAGPSLIFITIPNLFTQMPGGRWWGAVFFIFLTFAAMSTVVAVFEGIIAFFMDRFDWERKKSTVVSGIAITLLSMPCVFGFNIWSKIQLLGEGSSVLDFEDFIVSNNLLPLGSLAFVLFCTSKNGWGFENFIAEVNAGKGLKMPANAVSKFYMTWVLPLVIIAVYLKGYWDMFKPETGFDGRFFGWMAFALLFLAFIIFVALLGGRKLAALTAAAKPAEVELSEETE